MVHCGRGHSGRGSYSACLFFVFVIKFSEYMVVKDVKGEFTPFHNFVFCVNVYT